MHREGGAFLMGVQAAKMTPEDWEKIKSVAQVVSFRKNDVILEEGLVNRHLFIVKSGNVRIERELVRSESDRSV
jgi:CRP-like cAMP-binding protein